MVQVLGMITVDMHDRPAHVHPHQSSGYRPNASLFQHFPAGAVRRILARVNDSGDRGPRPIVGALDQQHLFTANNHTGHPG
ncbi:Uncharacterised protein [Mycobacteroides abscessus subsp. abscessus]|nr:Uncharacterised protein [Mycobacteroides abscessus subsp. abscessus]